MLTRHDLHPDERSTFHPGPLDPLDAAVTTAVLRSLVRYIGAEPTGRELWTQSPPYGWTLRLREPLLLRDGGRLVSLLCSRIPGVAQFLYVPRMSAHGRVAAVQAMQVARGLLAEEQERSAR